MSKWLRLNFDTILNLDSLDSIDREIIDAECSEEESSLFKRYRIIFFTKDRKYYSDFRRKDMWECYFEELINYLNADLVNNKVESILIEKRFGEEQKETK